MRNIQILDCTLRDGGYINDWFFGENTIKDITDKLQKASIDIIEVGFLTRKTNGKEYTLFSSTEQVRDIMPLEKTSIYVGMIAIGEKEIHPSEIENCDRSSIDGVRLTFHQNEVEKAIEWAKILTEKGYQVFMQPVGTIFYSDAELLDLVHKINQLNPYAFYIVDTLGSMYRNKLLYMFYLVDNNLNSNIKIGFHAHNNLQLAFSNVQELSRIQTQRDLIVDSSVYGMGRGAGNLPTELITQFINDNIEKRYDTAIILDIYDKDISVIREKYDWGYAVPYHIAASYGCHPNYASFLINKQTLLMENIEQIIKAIPLPERGIFNKKLIERLYAEYQNRKIDDAESIEKINEMIRNKNILVLAPGESLRIEKNKIESFIKEKTPYVISINFMDRCFPIDACFVSNHKRIEGIERERGNCKNACIITTSNIKFDTETNVINVDYDSYTNDDEVVFDNAGLMLFRLLIKCNVTEITLAGFDGFKTRFDTKKNRNFYKADLQLQMKGDVLEEKHNRIRSELNVIRKKLKITFLTKTSYEEDDVP